jgi:hypothetical protein
MTKRTLVGLVFLATLFAQEGRLHASEPLDMFDSQAAAIKHCGHDAVVWLDVPSHTFWLRGQRGYGASKTGGYTCENDAVKSGNRVKRG